LWGGGGGNGGALTGSRGGPAAWGGGGDIGGRDEGEIEGGHGEVASRSPNGAAEYEEAEKASGADGATAGGRVRDGGDEFGGGDFLGRGLPVPLEDGVAVEGDRRKSGSPELGRAVSAAKLRARVERGSVLWPSTSRHRTADSGLSVGVGISTAQHRE